MPDHSTSHNLLRIKLVKLLFDSCYNLYFLFQNFFSKINTKIIIILEFEMSELYKSSTFYF